MSAFTRRRVTLALGALALQRLAQAQPQASADTAARWPHKTVRILNPFPVGGGPDGTARFLAEQLARRWQRSVVVENRPGGNGFIAIDAFQRGARDGTDILLLDNVHLAAYPHLFTKLPYDVQQDFQVVLPLFRTYFFVCVAQHSPYQRVSELIADARARPGQLNYGSWSVGNAVHLGSLQLAALTGTQMEHVIFKETSQLYASVAQGALAFALGSSGTAGPLVRSGKLRLLAVMAPQRLPGFEKVPTVAESGGPAEAIVTGWNALAVAPQTPAAVVRRIHEDVRQVLRSPEIAPLFQTFGYQPYFPTPTEFAHFMAEESQRFAQLIRAAHIQL